MDGRKNRADPERYFPKGDSSLEGALRKMNYLRVNTQIKIAEPLKSQIYELISRSSSGMTVQEISAKLALNTKTCAKVLDEMIYKHAELKATAHRYGRVFVHKYHIVVEVKETQSPKREPVEEFPDIAPEILEEIKEVEADIGEYIKEAISQSLKNEKKHSRQRITQQSYIRALFVVARIRKLKVSSVYDIKEMIRNELEPNTKWCLDKKTVLRIIWKLRNCGIIKELCFRIRLRKDDDHEISFLGEHYDFITQDKLNNKSNTVIYKLLAAIPGISHTDQLVRDCPAIKNPTNRKPFTQNTATAKSTINIKSKQLREIVITQNSAYKKLKNTRCFKDVTENIIKMEEIINNIDSQSTDEALESSSEALSRAYSLAIFTKGVFRLLTSVVSSRYRLLFTTFRMPLCYTALKEIFNKPFRESNEKYSLAYNEFSLPLHDPDCSILTPTKIEPLIPITLPKKRKHTLEEMNFQLQKIFMLIERKPGEISNNYLKKLCKGIDTDPVLMLEYLKDLGCVHFRNSGWELDYKYNIF